MALSCSQRVCYPFRGNLRLKGSLAAARWRWIYHDICAPWQNTKVARRALGRRWSPEMISYSHNFYPHWRSVWVYGGSASRVARWFARNKLSESRETWTGETFRGKINSSTFRFQSKVVHHQRNVFFQRWRVITCQERVLNRSRNRPKLHDQRKTCFPHIATHAVPYKRWVPHIY